MDPTITGVIGLVFLFILMAVGLPVGFSMILVGVAGYFVLTGFSPVMGLLSTAPYTIVAAYTFSTLPLFVLMGEISVRGAIISDGYNAISKWVGHLSGGLSIATIIACAGFAACTGSSAASVAFMTKSMLPEMESRNYSPQLSLGAITSGSTLGILIPPSIPLVVYGLFAEQSIGELFIAAIVPGVLLTVFFIICVIVLTRINPVLGPSGPKSSWRVRFTNLRYIWPIVLLAVIILGGIWGGIFTPVEAGGMGAFSALLILILRRKFTPKVFLDAVKDSVYTSAMVFVIMVGAMIFSHFMALTHIPGNLAAAIGESGVSPLVVYLLIMVFYIIGGCLMDAVGLILLSLPVIIPIINALGINLIAFGIFQVIMIEMAQITPPVGINVFIASGIAKHIPMHIIFKGILPFFLVLLIMSVLLILFPEIALWLPSTMKG